MPTAQDILQFYFSPTTLYQSAQKIIPIKLTTLNDYNIDKLQKISEKIGASSFSFSENNLVPEVFRKFKNFINNNNNIKFERREIRILTYSLNYSEQNLQPIFNNENELKYVLTLLQLNWRDSFIVGLIDCFLRNWETTNVKSLEQLEQFIFKKLDDYEGKRSTLLSFKSNKRYFHTKNGSLILGDTITKLNKSIQEATKILGVPESWLGYSYFSKVIITYYERNKNKIVDEIDNIDNVLLKHNNSITNKKLISKIIIQANEPNFSTLQDRIKKIAFNQIGDPSNIANWSAFENATENERSEITKGRHILNEWITRQFISVFFNVCINDDRRKEFWLQFASKISSFKIYGPSHTKKMLKQDNRITEYVDARFETVSSNQNESAFILYIKNYMLIEFSNAGNAFYYYKYNSKYRPNLNRQLDNVDNLKNTAMPRIQNGNYFNDEGRMAHRDGNQNWETKFKSWLDKNVF